MKSQSKPLISAQIPTIGDGTMETRSAQLVLDKIAPIINNIARELGMFNARISQLEAIGPSVKINYSPRNLEEFQKSINVIRPPDLFAEEDVPVEAKKDEASNTPESN